MGEGKIPTKSRAIKEITERRALWLLLAAAAAARLLYCFFASPYDAGGPIPDIDVYQSFAHSLKTTGTFALDGALSASREPAYPIFLAGLYSIAGANVPAVWAAHTLMDLATIWILFDLGRRIFSRNVAWAAAVMAAFYPQMIYYVASPRRESLLVLLLAAGVWTML